jgi:hypothetical protein
MAPSLKTHVTRSCDSLILRRDFERRLRDIVGAKTTGQETAEKTSVFGKRQCQRLNEIKRRNIYISQTIKREYTEKLISFSND